MPHVDERESAAPVVGMVVVILAILTLGFWFLAGTPGNPPKSTAVAENEIAPGLDAGLIAPSPGRRPGTAGSSNGMGAGMIVGETPVFAGRDIHDVPLGEILNHAQTLPYDELRGHEETLGTNEQGQKVTARIWPESVASSMESVALRQAESSRELKAITPSGSSAWRWS